MSTTSVTPSGAPATLPADFDFSQGSQPNAGTPPATLPADFDFSQAPPKQPNAYERATASGPFVPAGAAEKAMGMGQTNTEQAKEALKLTGTATAETAAGVLGAAPLASGIESVSAAGAAGKEMLTQLAKEYPTAAKAVKMYTSWLAVHMAHKMGVPLPKVLELIGE
jgi:hypothetical protein